MGYEKRLLVQYDSLAALQIEGYSVCTTSSLTIEAAHNIPDFGPSVISLNKHALWVCVTELYGY